MTLKELVRIVKVFLARGSSGSLITFKQEVVWKKNFRKIESLSRRRRSCDFCSIVLIEDDNISFLAKNEHYIEKRINAIKISLNRKHSLIKPFCRPQVTRSIPWGFHSQLVFPWYVALVHNLRNWILFGIKP